MVSGAPTPRQTPRFNQHASGKLIVCVSLSVLEAISALASRSTVTRYRDDSTINAVVDNNLR